MRGRFAARDHFGAFLPARVDVGQYALLLLAGNERTHLRLRVQPGAEPNRGRRGADAGDDFVE